MTAARPPSSPVSAIIADAPLTAPAHQPAINPNEAAMFPVPVFAPTALRGPVATFTDANPTAPLQRLHGHDRLG